MNIKSAYAATALLLLAGCHHVSRVRPDPRATAGNGVDSILQPVDSSTTVNPAWLKPPTRFFSLGPGDRLEIEVIGEPSTRAQTIVAPDGKIYYYLLSGLSVQGLTLSEAKLRLEKELAGFIRGEPHVAVTLRHVGSKQIWLLGRLGTPGIYPLDSPMTLLEALALAGGPANSPTPLQTVSYVPGSTGMQDDLVDLRHSFVLREGHMLPIDFERLLHDGDLRQNIYLEPDDFVYLPTGSSGEVFVLGSVARPQPVSTANGEVTLISAIASAGGPIKGASLSQVGIVRGSLTEPKIAIADLQDILRGKAPDLRLQPGDIVFVPTSPFATISRYADLILNTFARTIGANEGTRAVVRNPAAVGVTVPLGL